MLVFGPRASEGEKKKMRRARGRKERTGRVGGEGGRAEGGGAWDMLMQFRVVCLFIYLFVAGFFFFL